MTGIVIVSSLILFLALAQLCLYLAERRAEREGLSYVDCEYAMSEIDGVGHDDAKFLATECLTRYGLCRDVPLDQTWARRLHEDTWLVLAGYQRMTFDGLTNQLEFESNSPVANVGGDDCVRIGNWPAGEPVFAVLRTTDPKIYIQVGQERLGLLAATIFHYILKTKQESDWANLALQEDGGDACP